MWDTRKVGDLHHNSYKIFQSFRFFYSPHHHQQFFCLVRVVFVASMLIAFPNVPKSVQIFLPVHKNFLTCRRQVCLHSSSSWSGITLRVLSCSYRTPMSLTVRKLFIVDAEIFVATVNPNPGADSVSESREYETLCSVLLGAGQDSSAGAALCSRELWGPAALSPRPCSAALLPGHLLTASTEEFALGILFPGWSTSLRNVLISSWLLIHLYLRTRSSTVNADV